jgi:pimeloyl-ACP methyl ester carboxylesterase
MRARYPDIEDFVERDGVKVGYEVFGDGDPAIVFVPIDAIVQSQAWKAQVPYFARRHKVITIDPRGNGRSDRPTDPIAYNDVEYVADTIAVMDAAGVDRAVLVGICTSGWRALLTAATHPDRVLAVVSIGTSAPYLTPPYDRGPIDFEAELDVYEGWQKNNRHYWLADWRGFAEFFFGQLLVEPHSSKQLEDTVGWAMDIGVQTMLVHGERTLATSGKEETEEILRQVRCPVITIHGDQDNCQPSRAANWSPKSPAASS